jgi:hypothetical protein
MHRIIYLSWATIPFTNAQLQRLLTLARKRNRELAVTGILLYGNERFVQVIEGEADTVKELYTHIRRDPRHSNFITFANNPAAQRVFADWTMAFQPVTSQQFDDVVGYLGLPSVARSTMDLPYSEGHLFDVLRSFIMA